MQPWELDRCTFNALIKDLPTRETVWGPGVGHHRMREYVIKLSKSKENRVYWAYWQYYMDSPYSRDCEDTRKRQLAHHMGRIAVAYLECHCHECRFVDRSFCPHNQDEVLHAYRSEYPEESEARYGYKEVEGQPKRSGVDWHRFFDESQCAIIEAMRERRQTMLSLFGTW